MNAARFASMGRAVILMGGGGHAAVVADAARTSGWNVLGFVSDDVPNEEERALQQRGGLAWLGTVEALGDLLRAAAPNTNVFAAVGDGTLRSRWIEHATGLSAPIATIVHATAVIAESASLEPGAFVSAQAVINPRAVVHAGAMVNTGAIIEHDCSIGAYAHIAPGSVLTGNVQVGAHAFVGARSVIIPDRVIGERAFVAAGSVVTQHVEPGMRVAGCPAVQKPRSQNAETLQ